MRTIVTFSKKAFTLIEMVIAIAILALLVAVVVPTLMKRSPQFERKQFVAQLNGITQFAWQHAITTGVLHRIFLNIRKRTIIVEQASKKKENGGKKVEFVPVQSPYIKTDFVWPTQLTIQSAYIDGKDTLQLFDEAYEFWFFIVPSGLTQDVILNFQDRKDTLAGRPAQLGLVLNPFTAQFKSYDKFQKP
jgi:prepilin-type N-terminal cleavage/methylation domain-containing protein